jgi:cell division protein FtsB
VKTLTTFLAILVVALQYPLWMGKGGWTRVWDLERNLAQQHEHNAKLKARNDALDAEVRDLKEGNEAIEERARLELGMVKRDETFYQVVSAQPATPGFRPPPGSDRALPERTSRGER